jgi:DNA-binding NtrC family response regulator
MAAQMIRHGAFQAQKGERLGHFSHADGGT